MPERIEVRAAAKMFFVKSLVIETGCDLLGIQAAANRRARDKRSREPNACRQQALMLLDRKHCRI